MICFAFFFVMRVSHAVLLDWFDFFSCHLYLVFRVAVRASFAQKEWASTTFAERKRVLNCLQRYILDHQDDIALVASRDSGKPRESYWLVLVQVISNVLLNCLSSVDGNIRFV